MKLKQLSFIAVTTIIAFSSFSHLYAAALQPQKPAAAPAPAPPPPPLPAPTPIQLTNSNIKTNLANNQIYASPGIATMQGGQWVGNDHLYNLPSSIGIVIELIKPTGQSVSFSEETLKEKIRTALATVKISSRDPIVSGGTPLPFFHLLVIVHPIEKGFIAYITGRLFEEVNLNRIHLKEGISWQAITWEKQELIVAPPEQLQTQVMLAVQAIVDSFTDRIKSYSFDKSLGN